MTIGFSNIDFNVSKGIEETTINNQDKIITSNGVYQADEGYTGLGTVTVETEGFIGETKTITENGIYTPDTGYDGFTEVTVKTPILIPIKTAGLNLWLDGDCNTRNGLDRSKKYFENLVWTRPFADNTKGDLENISNFNNNVWIDTNLLHLVNGYAQYPQMYCTASNEYTLEAVARITSSFSSGSQTIFSMGSANVGSYTLYVDSDNKFRIYFKGLNNTGYDLVTPTVSVGENIYLYYRVKTSSTDCGCSGSISTSSQSQRPTGHTAAFNTGFGCSSSTGTSPTASVGNIAVGMLRFWSRALTDSELQANYQDSKTRFNCI